MTSWRRLLLGSARATLSVVMEPLGPEKAVRKVEASRTADLADAELRRRSGFMSTARHSRESEVLARRESELADGHASFRYSGFLTVSAASESELVVACDIVQHAASQAASGHPPPLRRPGQRLHLHVAVCPWTRRTVTRRNACHPRKLQVSRVFNQVVA